MDSSADPKSCTLTVAAQMERHAKDARRVQVMRDFFNKSSTRARVAALLHESKQNCGSPAPARRMLRNQRTK